ncbi:MAG: hypothetical protein JWP52_1202 [Rhizobacter sp.]|nr:hypothetical protein [Rhizobacter sp.]
MSRWFVALCLLGLCSFGPRSVFAFSGEVTHVTDGDTVWVRPGESRPRARDDPAPIKVRLLGIDAPERCQAFGAAATRALRDKVLHRRVEIEPRATDRYERLLGTVTLDGRDVSAAMVREGWAWSGSSRRGGVYAVEQRQAQNERRGLFSEPNALPPWQFRKANGSCPR